MFRLKVELDGQDEPLHVQADGRDIRRWEAKHGKSWFETPGASYTDITFLAWSAAKRGGLFDGDWKAFDEACVRVSEEALDPTPPEATDELS